MTGLAAWARVHAPPPLVGVFLAAIAAETLLGDLPAMIPWAGHVDVRWGLLLPLVSIAACATALHSGMGVLEYPHRRRWRLVRAAWGLGLAVIAAAPAAWCHAGFSVSAALRNRLAIYALTCAGSLVVPVTLAILVPTVIVLVSMLVGGGGVPLSEIWLLNPHAGHVDLALAAAAVVGAAVAYAALSPPRWARLTQSSWT